MKRLICKIFGHKWKDEEEPVYKEDDKYSINFRTDLLPIAGPDSPTWYISHYEKTGYKICERCQERRKK